MVAASERFREKGVGHGPIWLCRLQCSNRSDNVICSIFTENTSHTEIGPQCSKMAFCQSVFASDFNYTETENGVFNRRKGMQTKRRLSWFQEI